MNDLELTSLVKEYIANIELISRKEANLDLFPQEDMLNRELSIDLFEIEMTDKVNFIINQPRVLDILVSA